MSDEAWGVRKLSSMSKPDNFCHADSPSGDTCRHELGGPCCQSRRLPGKMAAHVAADTIEQASCSHP